MRYSAPENKDYMWQHYPIVIIGGIFYVLKEHRIIEEEKLKAWIENVPEDEQEDFQSFIESLKDNSLVLPLERALSEDCVFDCYLNLYTNEIEEIDISSFTNSRVNYRSVLMNPSNHNIFKIYTIINNPVLTEPIVYFYNNVYNFDKITIERLGEIVYNTHARIARIDKNYEPVANQIIARQQLKVKLEPNESLAYIEAQLDILTKIVLELVKANPAVRQAVPELDEFETAFASTNLFNIKPFDKCLEEITKIKTKTRELQKKYYKAKEKISW